MDGVVRDEDRKEVFTMNETEQIRDLAAEIYNMADLELAFGKDLTVADYKDIKRIASKILELSEKQLEPPF